MNQYVLYLMGFVSVVVIIAGGVLLISLAARKIADIWSRFSALANNVREYRIAEADFRRYKEDFAFWENEKRRTVRRCKACDYRRQVLEQDKEDF